MSDQKTRFSALSLLCAALCLILTPALILPNGDAVSAYCETVLSALCSGSEERTLQRLSAAGENEYSETRANDAVSPLEEVPETLAADAAAPYETPADILEMEKAYLKKYENAGTAGTVRERFFVNDGATDVLGNVAVRNCAEEHKPDFEALLRQGAALEFKDKSEPLVLIFHTHTSEAYLLSDTGVYYEGYATRSADPAQSVVRVGEAICEVLNSRGIGCVHDTEIYDDTYEGAYARSREKVLEYLRQYPSIRIVLDVHRDAIRLSDTVLCKPTAVINGKKAAQVMIITGVEEGPVTDFPNWEQNLRFALALQQTSQDLHEGLMKPVYFCRRRYNMDVTPCSLLLEFGSDGNTLAEAVYAGTLFGEALSQFIEDHA